MNSRKISGRILHVVIALSILMIVVFFCGFLHDTVSLLETMNIPLWALAIPIALIVAVLVYIFWGSWKK